MSVGLFFFSMLQAYLNRSSIVKEKIFQTDPLPKCGAPWERIIEKLGGRDWKNDRMKEKGIPGELSGDGAYKRGQSMEPLNDTKKVKTLGWKPSCSCNDSDLDVGSHFSLPCPAVPCVVLDPFVGSGTTLKVAEGLGRVAIGLDLGYHELQKDRTSNNQIVLPVG